MLELKTKIAVRTVNRFLRDNPDNFDSVEWVLFDSIQSRPMNEAEADKSYEEITDYKVLI